MSLVRTTPAGIAGTGTFEGSTAATTHKIVLPTGIVKDDLLVAITRSASATTAHTWPSGWTSLVDSSADAIGRASIAWHWADGTEASAITATAANQKYASISLRVSGACNKTPAISTIVTGSSTTPDPGNVTAVVTGNYLFAWVGTWEGEQTCPPTGAPSNYTTASRAVASSAVAGATGTNCQVGAFWRTVSGVSSEDAGSTILSAAAPWSIWELAFYPAAQYGLEAAAAGVGAVAANLSGSQPASAIVAGTSSIIANLTNLVGDITTNLVGWWKLDEGSGNAVDSSGNGNTGTLTNTPTYVAGQVGPYAIHGTGTEYINVGNPASLQITGSITLAAWVYLDSTASAVNAIVGKGFSPGGISWMLILDDDPNNNLAMLVSSNGTLYAIRYANAQFATGGWHHVAGVYNSTAQTLTLYQDGSAIAGASTTLAGSQAVPASIYNTTGEVDIAARNAGNQPFHGAIDDVRIYSRVLTATDLAALYAWRTVTTTISGTSTVTANLTSAISPEISSIIAGTSAISASLQGTGALNSAIAGVGTIVAPLMGTGALAATLAGTSTQAAPLSGLQPAQALIAATSTATGNLLGNGVLQSTVNGIGAAAGGLFGNGALTTVAAGIATSTAALKGTGSLAATLAGISTVAASIGTIVNIAATIVGTSTFTANGEATTPGAAKAAIAATSTVTALLTGNGQLAATLAGTSAIAARLAGSVDVQATIAGTSTVTAPLSSYVAPVLVSASAAINGVSTVSAGLSAQIIAWGGHRGKFTRTHVEFKVGRAA